MVVIYTAPLLVFGFFGYRRWKRHYRSENSVLGYYLRYATGRRETDDPWPVYGLKIGVFLIWIVVVTSLRSG